MPVWLRSPTLSPTCPARCPPMTWMLQAGMAASSLIPPAMEMSLEATRLPRSWQRLGATACMQDQRYISSKLLSSFSLTTVSTCSSTLPNSAAGSCSWMEDIAIWREILWWLLRQAKAVSPPSISRTALQYSAGCVTMLSNYGNFLLQTAFTALKNAEISLVIAEAYSFDFCISISCGIWHSFSYWLILASTKALITSTCSRKAGLARSSLRRSTMPSMDYSSDPASQDYSGMASSSRSLRSLRMSSSSMQLQESEVLQQQARVMIKMAVRMLFA